MVRRMTVAITFLAFVNCMLAGCSTTRTVSRNELLLSSPKKQEIVGVILESGEKVPFDPGSGWFDAERQLVTGKPYTPGPRTLRRHAQDHAERLTRRTLTADSVLVFELEELWSVQVRKDSPGRTFLFVGAVAVIVAVTALVISLSNAEFGMGKWES